jgi:hypothetical protein
VWLPAGTKTVALAPNPRRSIVRAPEGVSAATVKRPSPLRGSSTYGDMGNKEKIAGAYEKLALGGGAATYTQLDDDG